MTKSITGLSEVTTVGLDLAKHVFQVHAIDASGAGSWPSSRLGKASAITAANEISDAMAE